MDDETQDQYFWLDLWMYFDYPELRQNIPEKDRDKYEQRYPRCQRLKEKENLINAACEAGEDIWEEKWNARQKRLQISYSEEEMKEIRAKAVEVIKRILEKRT
jgi:hypothetical protein